MNDCVHSVVFQKYKSTKQYSLKMGVGVRNLVEKMSYDWKTLGGWVYFFCHGHFLSHLPDLFLTPPLGALGIVPRF